MQLSGISDILLPLNGINERLFKLNNELLVYLRNHKKRNTPAKQEVFELLKKHEAITTLDLFAKVADQMDKTTFYRILKQFHEFKIIRETVINGVRKIELSDQFSNHHHHLVCGRCGKVVNIHDMKLEQYLKQLAPVNKFVHLSHSFEIIGLCPTCRPQPTANLSWAEVTAKY